LAVEIPSPIKLTTVIRLTDDKGQMILGF